MPSPTDHIRTRTTEAMKRIIATNKSITSRVKFAARIGTISSRISTWENGSGTPTLENIYRICKEFSVSPAWLILNEGSMFGSAELKSQIKELDKRVSDLEMLIKSK